MNTTLYYFSGTGNSLKLAKDLANQIGDCQLVPIAQIGRQERIAATAETIGLVTPLYYWGLPKIVFDFVQKLAAAPTTYFFTVINANEPRLSGAIHQLRGLLQTKSLTLHAGFHIPMPGNFAVWYNPPAPEEQQRRFRNAEAKIREIAEIVANKASVYDPEWFHFLRHFAHPGFIKSVNERDKNFTVTDACTTCGICQKICPVQNIALNGTRPQWQHHCQLCLACFQYCPQAAIQYGGKTANRTRYHHPEISVKELMRQSGAAEK